MSANDRVRLAGGPTLVGVAFVLGGLVAAVVPTRREYDEETDRLPANAYTLAYLEMLTRANPRDAHTRGAYVRRLSALGEYDAALAVLDRGADRDTPANAHLGFDLALARARSFPEGAPERAKAFGDVISRLEALASRPADAARTRELANLSLELERPALAVVFLERLAGQVPADDRPQVLAEAARWMRASGDNKGAAEAYLRAADLEADPTKSRDLTLSSIDSLEAANRVEEAADLATGTAARHPDDALFVQRAVHLAIAANRPMIARDWGRALLALRGDDEAETEAQARRELAAGDPKAALPLVERIVARRPDDTGWREVEARVAEWAGDPARALTDWLWLMQHGAASPEPRALP